MGTVILVGGDEFRPDCEAMDRALLAMAERQPARVVIVPTAAAFERPDLAARHGVDYFEALGATASAAMILTKQDANDTALVSGVAGSDVIYLTGGNPSYLADTLMDSAAWRTIVERHGQGGMVAGSSAGAMVLAGLMRAGAGKWAAGLNLAPEVAVIPHHPDRPLGDTAQVRQNLSAAYTVLGMPTASGCWTSDGRMWHAVGARPIWVYRPAGIQAYPPGSEFTAF
jgi:cyanophycinase